jgi:polar amino acid transport system substrate-binding protein
MFGGGFDEYLRKELTFEESGTMSDNFQKLELGQIEYFVTGLMAGQAGLLALGKEQKIVSLPLPVTDSGIYFGFSRRSPCVAMVEEFSRKLEDLDAQGIPQQLVQKYMKQLEERRTESRR